MRNPLPRRGHNELFRKKLLSPGAAPQQVDRVSAQTRQPLPHLDRLPNSGNLGTRRPGQTAPRAGSGTRQSKSWSWRRVSPGVTDPFRCVCTTERERPALASRRTGSAAFWHANAGRTNKVSASGPILVGAQN